MVGMVKDTGGWRGLRDVHHRVMCTSSLDDVDALHTGRKKLQQKSACMCVGTYCRPQYAYVSHLKPRGTYLG